MAIGAGVVETEFVHAFEVEPERAEFAVDLEPVGVVVAGCQTTGFERGDPAATQPGEKHNRVVDSALALRSRSGRSRPGDLAASAFIE